MDRIQEIDKMVEDLRNELHEEVRYRVNEALGGRLDTDSDIDIILDKIIKLEVERAYWIAKQGGLPKL